MPNHEVISAFLDNEPFDTGELGHALGEPGGRELLLDLMALRAVVQEEAIDHGVAARIAKGPTRAWWIVSAAAVLIAVVGGFTMGSRSEQASSKAAPAPTVVVTNEHGWSESKGGN